jgi:hypothetical protein
MAAGKVFEGYVLKMNRDQSGLVWMSVWFVLLVDDEKVHFQ